VTSSRNLRLGYLVSHPIQYQAPLLRRISTEPDIDLHVFFGSDLSVRSYKDEGFGANVEWDVPLLEGYSSEFLPSVRDKRRISVASPVNRGIYDRLHGRGGAPAIDVLWVHGYATVNAMHGMIAARALGIPVLLRAESWLKDRERSGVKLVAKQAFFRGLRQMVDAVLPIGSLNSAYWSYYLGDEMPQFLMPYAVDNDYFQARSRAAVASREALARELELQLGRPVILFASKLQTRKRCDDLLEATRRLATQLSPDRQPYLLIVGDGEERSNLERKVAEAGTTNIRFCGFRNQSELPRFFDLCDVFVLPSRHEPWGLIVNEVMNAGRAVIVSDDVGSQPDLITDGIEGCVFPVGDVDALTAALLRVLAEPGTAAAMGARARERISRWGFEEDMLGLRAALEHVGRRLRA
jgi:glycosyltransferase involved in cell wall biosynthesis